MGFEVNILKFKNIKLLLVSLIKLQFLKPITCRRVRISADFNIEDFEICFYFYFAKMCEKKTQMFVSDSIENKYTIKKIGFYAAVRNNDKQSECI